MNANYYKLFIILKIICPQLSNWRIEEVISSLKINHTIYTVINMKEVEHRRGPALVITTKSGRTTLHNNQETIIGLQRIESTLPIGLGPLLSSLLFSYIVYVILQMQVDSTQMKTQELSKRRMESSNASCKLESPCFSIFQEWEPLSLTLRVKDLVTSSEIKLLDLWFHSLSQFSYS